MRYAGSTVRRPRRRRGFTLVELLIAGIAGLLVLAAVSSALFQSARARATTNSRLVAYSRAMSALDLLRGEIASTIRRSDLFETRILLYDEEQLTPIGELSRDELLVFNVSLDPIRPIDYEGEGQEYESHFRIGDDVTGVALWQRRDPVLDEWSDAGGLASPVATGILALDIEAYDGESWFSEWDSDIDGLPWAIRFTVTASGVELGEDPYDPDGPLVRLRTQVAIDRIIPPPPPVPEDEEEQEGAGQDDTAGSGGVAGGGRLPTGEGSGGDSGEGGGRPNGGGRPGGGRPGGGRPGGGRPGGGRPGGGFGGGRQ